MLHAGLLPPAVPIEGQRRADGKIVWTDCSGGAEDRITGGQFAAGVMGTITVFMALALLANIFWRRQLRG